MESLRDMFQRRPVKVSGPLSTEELKALDAAEKKQQHLRDCLKCRGETKIAGWPCMDEPDYKMKMKRHSRGLPWEVHTTFKSYKPRDYQDRATYVTCQKWADRPEGWLPLVGAPGAGKTHLATAVTERLLEREVVGVFWQVADLLDFWRSLYDREMDPKTAWESWDIVAVLDDLGAERPTEWAIEKLGQFLDWRVRGRLPTLITSNFGKEELGARLHPRIADRVFDTGSGLVQVERLTGKSYRTER